MFSIRPLLLTTRAITHVHRAPQNICGSLRTYLDSARTALPPSSDVSFTALEEKLPHLIGKRHSAQLNNLFIGFLHKLNDKRSEMDDDAEWNQFVEDTHKSYPLLLDICHSDPFTKRCFDKPRGYSGDAVTLDMIYKKEKPTHTSALGEDIFECLIEHDKTAAAVRARAEFIGNYIDDLCVKQDRKLNVLSIACGHLRELEACQQFWNGNINVTGFDQDALSLNRLKQDYGDRGYNITTIEGSISDLFNSKYCNQLISDANDGNKFDLIWSAGLCDYLYDNTCQKLTKQLFDMIEPSGGKLLIANFMPSDTVIRGYMECFMDWKLIYRNVDQIQRFTKRINKEQISFTQIHELQNIAFIEMAKN